MNTDSVDHELHTSLPGFDPVDVIAGANAVLDVALPANSTHRIWSATQRGDLIGLETLVRAGWQDEPHFEWNLNEWNPAATCKFGGRFGGGFDCAIRAQAVHHQRPEFP
ncbi:MAG: hypothetical protein O3B70_08855 [Bacteroidetes bacterium]|nr:hypothetical protein [Bacteroidota bacterium]MDA0904432.1 hypothetical protein [Bacteroidota bacterium]MDA1243264.1 hypothetical protein [Bacteroidota bacterium]